MRRRTAAGIPREAIRFCLERGGTGWSGIECVAVASRPVRTWVRHAWMRAKLTPFAPVPSGYYQTKLGASANLGRELNNGHSMLEMLGESPAPEGRCTSTIISATLRKRVLCVRCRPRALVLTLDEQGDGRSGLIAARRRQPPARSRIDSFSAFTGVDFYADHGFDRLHAPRGRTQDAMAGPGGRSRIRVFVSGDAAPRSPGKLLAPRHALLQRGPGGAHRVISKILPSRRVDPAIGKAAEAVFAAPADSRAVAQA